MKIKNPNYRKFLDEGIIDPVTEDHIESALKNIKGHHVREGRALLLTLYYTGARPNEVLRIKGGDVVKEDSYIVIKLPGSKGGLPRSLYFPHRKRLIREIYEYAAGLFPDSFLFYHYQNRHVRMVMTRKGLKERITISDKLRYYLNNWFTGVIEHSISPYFLRHSRFSKLAQKGVSIQDLRMLKGSRSAESVNYYIHMSTESAKKIAKKMD